MIAGDETEFVALCFVQEYLGDGAAVVVVVVQAVVEGSGYRWSWGQRSRLRM